MLFSAHRLPEVTRRLMRFERLDFPEDNCTLKEIVIFKDISSRLFILTDRCTSQTAALTLRQLDFSQIRKQVYMDRLGVK